MVAARRMCAGSLSGGQTTIRLSRRTYSPILRQASLPETITVPWWDGRTLRYQYD